MKRIKEKIKKKCEYTYDLDSDPNIANSSLKKRKIMDINENEENTSENSEESEEIEIPILRDITKGNIL